MELTYRERTDLRKMMKRVIGGTPEKCPDAYKWRTPLYYLERLKAPVLIIHGCHDENVSVEHSVRLENRLRDLQRPVTTWYFEDYTHYFPPAENIRVVEGLTKWMKERENQSL